MHGNLATMTDETSGPTPIPGLGWCVLAVWSGQEWNVQRDIVDYPTYLPIEKRIVVIRGRKVIKHRPLIYGYLFVQIDLANDDRWGKFSRQNQGKGGLRGCIGLVKNNDKPCVVPAQVIDRIKLAESAGLFDYTSKSPFRIGEQVEILDGRWAGFIGKIKSASPRKRAKIMMGAFVIDVDVVNLKKVGA